MNPGTKKRKASSLSALDLIEAAVHLLRNAPGGALLSYYIGSVPGLLGLLYFWADMTQGAFAQARMIEASLGAAFWFAWMKCWQAVCASKLRAHLLRQPEPSWTLRRVTRLATVQLALQPFGLLFRPLAAQVLVPYVWVYGFFQSLTVLGDGSAPGLRETIRAAARQAGLWPRQAHLALLCLFGFAFAIWINIATAAYLAPQLLRTFLGIESVFSRGGLAMINTTTILATLAVTYLCFDPVRKALYVLRCFHGDSLKTGGDLRLQLQTFRPSAGAATRTAFAALLIGGLLGAYTLQAAPAADALREARSSTSQANGGETSPGRHSSASARVEAGRLSASIDRVLQRRAYAWRFPREERVQPDEQKTWLAIFFEELWKKMKATMRKIQHIGTRVKEWFDKTFGHDPAASDSSHNGSGINWASTAWWTLIILATALLILLGFLLWRFRHPRAAGVLAAAPVTAAPDLTRDDVTADLLPEDGWLNLARELMQQGEQRLALRAFYLAGLAHLGQRELILLARHKSNHDYDRELRRRARSDVGLIQAFDTTIQEFERAWYGDHAVSSETLNVFSTHLERIRAC